jgi:hypothetical protein
MQVVARRKEWLVLALGVGAAIALALWVMRGTTLYVDEVNFFESSHGLAPRWLLTPVNGHLLLIPHALYAVSFSLFGPSYLPLRIAQLIGVVTAAALFFVLAKRRVGAGTALAPTLLLLVFGSSWEITLSPLGIPNVYSIAAGLGALVMLERGDRLGDLGGCLLLVAAIASYSVGLAFVVAAAVWVLLEPDRWRRAWIFLVPMVLYGAWWLAKPSLETAFSGLKTEPQLSNLSGTPDFIANSAAAVALALTGLNYDRSPHSALLSPPANSDPWWGFVVAALAVAAVALAVRRGRPSSFLWAALTLLLALWTSYALVASEAGRSPESARYIYPGAVAVLILAVEAARGLRPNHLALAAIYGVTSISLFFNVAHMFQGGSFLRSYSAQARGQFTAVELARGRLDPSFTLPFSPIAFLLALDPESYLAAVDRFGSPAFPVSELQDKSEKTREEADKTLAAALGIKVAPASPNVRVHGCHRLPSARTSTGFAAKPPGAILQSSIPAEVAVGRFAVPTVEVGRLPADRQSFLAIPADRSTLPWHATVTPATRPVTVCKLG